MVKGYSTPVGRSRHGKRLPRVLDDGSGSVTTPGTTVVPPTVTIFLFPSSFVQPTVTSTVVVSTDADSSSAVVYSSQTSVSSGTYGGTGNSGASSNITTGKEDVVQTAPPSTSASPSSSSSTGTPVGAVVGVVLAVILLLAAGGVLWFRRQSIASRLRKRKWAKQQQNAPSFLFIEPQKSIKVLQSPVTNSNTLRSYRSRDPVAPVNMTFTGPDGVGHYIPYPAPPRPPPAAGMYDTHTIPDTPTTTSPSKVSIRVSPSPATPSPVASLSPPKQAETAKVRATFIPTLPDELTISTGEMVRIHAEYDDGWCLCSNARGEMGMIPLECLDKASQLPQEKSTNREYRRSVRVSSLAATPKSPYDTPKSPYGGNTPKSPYGGNTSRSPYGEGITWSPSGGNQQ